ncbi:hypothetical protein FOA52_008334 [Chlamydomonas sp. UWO 241]|nr:hypothetical protein FOA52_008334 [Chlamydomonas sp. UWO 241]
MCYTSGTPGNPKGVLYSHRSNFLHAMVLTQMDNWPMGSSTVALAIVPMFHANSWGMVFAAPMVGARVVLPGPWLDGENVYNLLEDFRVTLSAGVPTVWMNLLNFMEARGVSPTTLKLIAIGGSAASHAMIDSFEVTHKVTVSHLWGMTEISPLGTVGGPKAPVTRWRPEDVRRNKIKQGRPHILCDMRVVDDAGVVQAHDGKSMGHLQVRGPIVVSSYYKNSKLATDADGWFSTGDVASIDALGHMAITDRSKDVVKSGGEWISTIDIENLAMGHPLVAEAAVIAIPNKKWDERPLLIVVLKPHVEVAADHETVKEQLYRHLDGKLARYAVPDDIVFVPEIPHNATGKVSKLTLREMFKDFKPARPRL